MVNNPLRGPEYALQEVFNAVRTGNLQYHGRRVQVDAANLGFQYEDICDCLLNLGLDRFEGTVIYTFKDGTEQLCDTYVTQHCARSQSLPDPLYVKFFMRDPVLRLCSFHRPR
jgi:hypothetical protein